MLRNTSLLPSPHKLMAVGERRSFRIAHQMKACVSSSSFIRALPRTRPATAHQSLRCSSLAPHAGRRCAAWRVPVRDGRRLCRLVQTRSLLQRRLAQADLRRVAYRGCRLQLPFRSWYRSVCDFNGRIKMSGSHILLRRHWPGLSSLTSERLKLRNDRLIRHFDIRHIRHT